MTGVRERPNRRFFGRRTLAGCLLLVLPVLCSCEGGDKMAPLPPHFSASALDRVPVILLGQIMENSRSTGSQRTWQTSEWDGKPVQLMRVRVRVEQVLQGEPPPKEVEIFYFTDLAAGESSVARVWRDLNAGHSEIFFLQRDYGKLRTICDGWRSCIIWVRTGTHYNFKPEPGTPIEDVITNILLRRGDHTTDEQMIDAMYHPELRWGTLPIYNALKQLAVNEKSLAVRVVALERLRNFEIHYGPLRRATPIVSKQQ
jgi:hypothetical protein